MSFKVDFSLIPQPKIRGRADVIEHEIRALDNLQALYGGEFRVSARGTPYLVIDNRRVGIWWMIHDETTIAGEQEVRAWLKDHAMTSLIG